MKKSYVKSLKEYDDSYEIDSKKILAAMKRYKNTKKNRGIFFLIFPKRFFSLGKIIFFKHVVNY